MAYDRTKVPVAKSQAAIRSMIYKHRGMAVNFLSQRPREGFEALMTIAEKPYHIRVMATCKTKSNQNGNDQEEGRVWRVLYHHLKAIFEASDSGVIDIRDVIMPYVVTRDGRTLS